MTERSKVTVLKTVEPFWGSVGSNPTPSAPLAAMGGESMQFEPRSNLWPDDSHLALGWRPTVWCK